MRLVPLLSLLPALALAHAFPHRSEPTNATSSEAFFVESGIHLEWDRVVSNAVSLFRDGGPPLAIASSSPAPQASAVTAPQPTTMRSIQVGSLVAGGQFTYQLVERVHGLSDTAVFVTGALPAGTSVLHDLLALDGGSTTSRPFDRAVSLDVLDVCPAPPRTQYDGSTRDLDVALQSTSSRSQPPSRASRDNLSDPLDGGYTLGARVGKGGHGEVWRAVKFSEGDDADDDGSSSDARGASTFILKRLFSVRGWLWLDVTVACALRLLYGG